MTVRASDRPRSRCAATGQDLAVEGDVRLRDGAALRSSAVAGTVTAAGDVTMHSVAAGGVEVESGGAAPRRNLTVRAGVATAAGARAALDRLASCSSRSPARSR